MESIFLATVVGWQAISTTFIHIWHEVTVSLITTGLSLVYHGNEYNVGSNGGSFLDQKINNYRFIGSFLLSELRR